MNDETHVETRKIDRGGNNDFGDDGQDLVVAFLPAMPSKLFDLRFEFGVPPSKVFVLRLELGVSPSQLSDENALMPFQRREQWKKI